MGLVRLAAAAAMTGLAGLGGWVAMAKAPADHVGEEPYIADGVLKFLLVDASGKVEQERRFSLLLARDRLGNLYRAQERPEGKLVNLWVKKTGVSYLIDHARKTIETLGHMEMNPSDPRVRAAAAGGRGGGAQGSSGLGLRAGTGIRHAGW